MSHPPLTDPQRTMVENNLGLVGFVISRYYPNLNGDDDAFQNGVTGLMRAVTDYDPTVARFSTYAVAWIRQAVGRGLNELDGINARRIRAAGGTWTPPLSLDYVAAGTSDDPSPMTDWVAGTAPDPADTVTDRISHDDFARALTRCATNALDRDIAQRLAAIAAGTPHDSYATIGARRGYTAENVRRRTLQLQAAVRELLDAQVPA